MKKILATGAMLAYIAWFNSSGGTAMAAGLQEISTSDIQGPKYHQNIRHTKTGEEKIGRLAQKLGLDIEQLNHDLKSGMTTKQILKKYKINKNQFRELTRYQA